MNAQINRLVKSLLQKDSIEECSVHELQQYAERHPYLGAAQLLLTKKLQSENNEGYNKQLQKTLLYFHNPFWVEQLLNDTGNAAQHQPAEITPEIVPAPVQTEKKDTPPLAPEEIKMETPAEPAVEIKTIKEATEETGTGDLLFEPYHTVDYFASQGIRFKEEEKPADTFGRQLKSFTEWLKTMKKLPAAGATGTPDIQTDQKVEQMAESSIKEREVLTEAMAEVWEKQGNTGKALEIYSKLSLLEPSKSTYFAAKIEELKKKN